MFDTAWKPATPFRPAAHPPNHAAFCAMPESITEAVGMGVNPYARIDACVLSTMMWYAQEAATRGYNAEGLAKGEFALHPDRVASNIWDRWFHGTLDGNFRGRVTRAITGLVESGMIMRFRPLSATGARNDGFVWGFEDTPLEPYVGHLPTLSAATGGLLVRPRIGHPAIRGLTNVADMAGGALTGETHQAFSVTEGCYSVGSRGVSVDWKSFLHSTAKNGAPKSRFVSVGAFRPGETSQVESMVMIPWYVIDIDRADPFDAHGDMAEILYLLQERSVDMTSVFVTYTGGKGYHIRIPSGALGNPVFRNVAEARKVVSTLYQILCSGVDYDPKVSDPLQLIRIAGSMRGDIQCRMTPASEVLGERFVMSHEKIALASRGHAPQEVIDPTGVKPNPHLMLALMSANDLSRRAQIPVFNRKNLPEEGGSDGSTVIQAAIAGVEENVEWHEPRGTRSYTGRNYAMFIAACHWLRQNSNEEIAWHNLSETNKKNTPPLRASELTSCFRSARRSVGRDGYGDHK